MAEGGVQRRLAAIVIADLVGYSRHMERDPTGTRERFQSIRKELVEPILAEHQGRIVKTMGDAYLFEFASVVSAVAAVVEFQRSMAKVQATEANPIQFRIGVNLGEIIAEGDDIHGEGVNVAARLEALADPGGIVISGRVHEQLHEAVDVGYEFMGEQQVKNVERLVRAYKVLLDPADAGKAPTQTTAAKTTPRPYKSIAAAVVLLIALVGGGYWYWQSQQPDFEPADPKKLVYELPDAPSIAVLPFRYLGANKASNDYLADGLSDNLIVALSQIPDLFVIARGTSSSFKDKAMDFRTVSEAFGVRYILTGSVQKSGDKIRISSKLVDGIDGRNIWAATFDRPLDQIFQTQDEITKEIAIAMQVNVIESPSAPWRARGVQNLKAWSLALKADHLIFQFTPETTLKGDALAESAVALEESYAHPWALRAWARFNAARYERGKKREALIREGMMFADRALSLDTINPFATMAKAVLLLLKGNFVEAVKYGNRAVELAPSLPDVQIQMSLILRFSGDYDGAVEMAKQAMRLHPKHRYSFYYVQGINLVFAGRFEELLEFWSEHQQKVPAKFPIFLSHQIMAYGALGKASKARQLADELKKSIPTVSGDIWRRLFPIRDKNLLEERIALLVKAGIPEYPPSKKPIKPSIAVLPFANLSDDKEQEYFADGMTDDLITDLSKVSGLIVIARNSVFTYKGKNVKVQEVAKDLGVTHVLEGSVRSAGEKIRINAQLIDAKTGAHLWAETYDRNFADIFQIQDEVTAAIVSALTIELPNEEKSVLAKTPTTNLDAYDFYLRGEAKRLTFGKSSTSQSIAEYHNALELDPGFIEARLGLARASIWSWKLGWHYQAMPDGKQPIDVARNQLAKIKELDPDNLGAEDLRIELTMLDGNLENARTMINEALRLYPRSAQLYYRMAQVNLFQGDDAASLKAARKALVLTPGPDLDLWQLLSRVLISAGDPERALKLLESVLELEKHHFQPAFALFMANTALGNLTAAQKEFDYIRRYWPDINLQWIRVWFQQSKRPDFEKVYLQNFKKFDVPEWPRDTKLMAENRLDANAIKELVANKALISHDQITDMYANGDLLCVFEKKAIFGRPYCTPVFKDPDYIRKKFRQNDTYVSYTIFPRGFRTFSLRAHD